MAHMPNGVDEWLVLIVDDHFDNVQIAKTALEFYGAKVAIAEDGEEALHEARAIQPTIVLMDLSMPTMNGYDALKGLRRMPHLATVPIVAVTAHAMPSDRTRALQAGFDGYLSKPYDVTSLVHFMGEVIQTKRGSATQ